MSEKRKTRTSEASKDASEYAAPDCYVTLATVIFLCVQFPIRVYPFLFINLISGNTGFFEEEATPWTLVLKDKLLKSQSMQIYNHLDKKNHRLLPLQIHNTDFINNQKLLSTFG